MKAVIYILPKPMVQPIKRREISIGFAKHLKASDINRDAF